MIEYILLEEEFVLQNAEEYIGYGIAAKDGECIVCSVSDISNSKSNVLGIIELCNNEHLSPLHLEEIAESFLYGLVF